MTEALQPPAVSPEVLAIIDQGKPTPQVAKPAVAVDAVAVQPVSVVVARPADAPKQAAKPVTGKGREVEKNVTVTATYRLPEKIMDALFKASIDRKIKKVTPHTKQDIVAEALNEWLKKNGFF